MRLKIGILGSRGIPNAYGGFEQFAEQLAAGLVKKGHEVWVYNSSLHPYKEAAWQGVHIIHCKDWEDKLDAAGQFIYDFNCLLDSRKRNFDVLLQLGYTSNSIWHWWWPKKTVNIVNMDGLEWKRTQYSKITRAFIKKAEAWAAKYADIMVADSLGMQQHLFANFGKASVFIPYAAQVFDKADPSVLKQFNLLPNRYYLSVSRMEPENNVEMIIKGYLESGQQDPLIMVGKLNRFGKSWEKKYQDKRIRFLGAIYEKHILSNLRHFSKLHFHGHSVGGTNPSLLEAMGCSCQIAAHDNIFNRAILGVDADFFSSETDLAAILIAPVSEEEKNKRKLNNVSKIKTIYHPDKIINDYERLMLDCYRNQG